VQQCAKGAMKNKKGYTVAHLIQEKRLPVIVMRLGVYCDVYCDAYCDATGRLL